MISTKNDYFCCCGIFHVKYIVRIIAIINYLGYICSFIAFFFNPVQTTWNTLLLIRNNIGVFIFSAMLFGLKKTIPVLFIPCLGLQLFNIVFGITVITALLFSMQETGDIAQFYRRLIRDMCKLRDGENLATSKQFIEIAIHSILILSSIWFFIIILKCYYYVDEKKKASLRYQNTAS